MSEVQTAPAEPTNAQFVRALRATTVHLNDGTSAFAKTGSVWSTDEMADHFVGMLATDGSWTSNLFDTATREDWEAYKATDPKLLEQKDFMIRNFGEFAHVELPEPDSIAAITEAGRLQVDPDRKAPIEAPPAPTSEETTSEETATEETTETEVTEETATEEPAAEAGASEDTTTE